MLDDLLAHHRLDISFLIILERHDFQGTQVGDVVRGHAVVVEQIPLTFVLHDAVMGCPAHHRLQDHTLYKLGLTQSLPPLRILANPPPPCHDSTSWDSLVSASLRDDRLVVPRRVELLFRE